MTTTELDPQASLRVAAVDRDFAPWVRRPKGRIVHALSRRYAGFSPARRTAWEIGLGLVALPVLGFLAFLPIAYTVPAVLDVIFWILLAALIFTSVIIGVECARATRFPEPPLDREATDDELPRLAAVIAAYLPNEADTILDSLRAHLALDYPRDKHLVVLAYNTPNDLAVEADILALAASDPRLLPLRVDGSTSKAANVNTAVGLLSESVDVIAVFDADHRPDPSAGRRAARWLSDAAGDKRFDVVQGQCLVRNSDENRLTRLIAAEFATIYAVAHPGRTVFNDFGIFGGSNGWWRAEVLAELGLDGAMLTEDIDVTARALAQGRRLGTDPRIVSSELAPPTVALLWNQRLRWAQGWHEVMLRRSRGLLANPALTGTQRRGVALVMVWRGIHPWISPLLIPSVLARITPPDHPQVHWDLLVFMFTGALVQGIPLIQAGVANRVAPPPLGGRRVLFLGFALACMAGYAEFKAMTNRVAVVRDLFGAHQWVVTPRSASADRSAS